MEREETIEEEAEIDPALFEAADRVIDEYLQDASAPKVNNELSESAVNGVVHCLTDDLGRPDLDSRITQQLTNYIRTKLENRLSE